MCAGPESLAHQAGAVGTLAVRSGKATSQIPGALSGAEQLEGLTPGVPRD